MTTPSSASKSTRPAPAGNWMASPGPMTAVDGFTKITGSDGTDRFVSRA